MLRLARDRETGLRGGGLFSPRNEGPLIDGESSVAAGARGGSGLANGVVSPRIGVGPGGGADTGWGFGGIGAGANNVAPHIPQKRLSAGFSLPHRGHRTEPPAFPYRLRYLEALIQNTPLQEHAE